MVIGLTQRHLLPNGQLVKLSDLFAFALSKTFRARSRNPARATTSMIIFPTISILGQLVMVKYGVNMQASVAPKAAAKPCTSVHAGRDVHRENSTNAIVAHATHAMIATQNGCIGLGINCWPMSQNQAEPMTNAVNPPSHAGIVLRWSSAEGRPKPRTR